jgi:hypothetical protein
MGDADWWACWTALGSLAVVVVVGCAQQVPPSEATLRMKAQCLEAGRKARQEWVTQYDQETFSNAPEYGYSAALNTCLYADEYSDINPGERAPLLLGTKSRRDRFVLDVYSGKVLVEYTEHDGKSITTEPDPVMCRTEQEFEARKAKLFGSESH